MSRMRCPVIIGPAIASRWLDRARLAHRPGMRERDVACCCRPRARPGRPAPRRNTRRPQATQRTMPARRRGGIRHSCGRGVATLPIGWPGHDPISRHAPLGSKRKRRAGPTPGAGLDEGPVRGVERTQQPIENCTENRRDPTRRTSGLPRPAHRIARLEARRILVNLRHEFVRTQLDHLAQKSAADPRRPPRTRGIHPECRRAAPGR